MFATVSWCRARRAAIFAAAIVFASALVPLAPSAQEVTPEVENRSDQLDVPFVPSGNKVLDAMFRFAKPTPKDYVIDLGSGDGRIVIAAAKSYGASGYGVDLNEGLVKVANARAAKEGVGARAKFYVRDLFKEDFSRATIVTMYLLPEVVLRLRPKLFALKPGTRIVSHDYHLGDWRFDKATVIPSETRGEEDIVYYWVVPAHVAGQWNWTVSYPAYFNGAVKYEGHIGQHFQDIDGKLVVNLNNMRIHDAKITGDRIAFSATGEMEERIVRHDFVGTVKGDRIEGTVHLSGGVQDATVPWSAYRVKADN